MRSRTDRWAGSAALVVVLSGSAAFLYGAYYQSANVMTPAAVFASTALYLLFNRNPTNVKSTTGSDAVQEELDS